MPAPIVTQTETVVTPNGSTEPAHVSLDPSEYPRMQPRFQCRNGQLVKASTQTMIADRLNHIAYYGGKQHFSAGGNVVSIPSGASGSRNRWRFSGHTGPLANTLVARITVAASYPAIGIPPNPYVRLTIQDTSGNELGHADVYGGLAAAATSDVPSEFVTGTVAIDCSGFPDTDFRAIVTDNDYARALSITVYEIESPGVVLDGYIPSPYSIGGQIYDFHRGDAAKLAARLWKRGRAPIFTYSSNLDSSAPITSSLTGVNVNDNASGSPSPSVPGYTVDLRYMNRKSATTVPVRFEVYVSNTSATGAFISLVSSDGTTLILNGPPGATTGAWYSLTANIPATLQTLYLFHGVKSAGSVTTYAACLYPYA